jgi:hypothetical protein
MLGFINRASNNGTAPTEQAVQGAGTLTASAGTAAALAVQADVPWGRASGEVEPSTPARLNTARYPASAGGVQPPVPLQAGPGAQAVQSSTLALAPAHSGPTVSPRRFSVSGVVTRTASSFVQGVVRGLMLTESGAPISAGGATNQESTAGADGSWAQQATGDLSAGAVPASSTTTTTTSSYTYMLAFETSLDALRWAHAAQVCGVCASQSCRLAAQSFCYYVPHLFIPG